MGMAASQARLLSLTARLHDVELQAQNIMSQKIALATQKDALYQDYCDALEATTIKVAYMDGMGGKNFVDANYSTLCTYNENRYKQYALRDNMSGQLIVSQEVKDAYDNFGNDKYAFAYAMVGFENSFGWNDQYEGMCVGYGLSQSNSGDADGIVQYIEEADGSTSIYMTECEQMVYDAHKDSDPDLVEKYEAIFEAEGASDKTKALDEFRDYLYTHVDKETGTNYAEEIYNNMNYNKQGTKGVDNDLIFPDKTWADIKQEFNYYINLWSAINEAGGCQTMDPQYESGEQGNEWFNNMVESGLVSILVWDDTGSRKEWSETSVATSTNNNYLQEVQDDKDLKKAEAEYEHELDILNRKDTKFDTDLSKLETERTSITTEMESIKKVRDDNIDRTFGIFS